MSLRQELTNVYVSAHERMIHRSANKGTGNCSRERTRRELELFTSNSAALGKSLDETKGSWQGVQMSEGWDIVMWRRPGMAVLVLASGTLMYYHCAVRNRNIVTLASDVLLVFSWSLALLGLVFRYFNLSMLQVDPLEWQVSAESANCIAAMVANTLGATESVLRIAARGTDIKLFLKVILTLYLLSVVGRAASGASLVYVGLWIVFTVPVCTSKLAPQAKPPSFFQPRGKAQTDGS